MSDLSSEDSEEDNSTLSNEELEKKLAGKRKRDQRRAMLAELEERKNKKKSPSGSATSSSSSTGLDALATAAIVVSSAASGKEFIQREATDLDGNNLLVFDKRNFTERMEATQFHRRVITKSRLIPYSTEGTTVFAGDRIMRELDVQSLEHDSSANLLVGTEEEVKARDVDSWLSATMWPDIKGIEAIKILSLFNKFVAGEFITNNYENLSLCRLALAAPLSHSFDKNPDHAIAKASLVLRLENLDAARTTVYGLEWLQASRHFIQGVKTGGHKYVPVDFLHYKVHEVLAKYKRMMDRKIVIDGVEVQIKNPAEAVGLYKDLLGKMELTLTAEEENMFRKHRDASIVRPTQGPPTAVDHVSSAALDTTGTVISASSRRRNSRKVHATAAKAVVIPAVVTVASVPASLPPQVQPPAVGATQRKHVCVANLADISGLFAGVVCTYGAKCKFRHELTLAAVSRAEALAAIDRGAGTKLSVVQAAALKVHVEVTCT